MSFIPYTPPNEGANLLNVDRDLCWRINPRGLVSPAVIGAVCWARNHFRMSDAQHLSVLNGLGLEYQRQQSGGVVLRPKETHRVAIYRPEQDAPRTNNAMSFPTFSLINPLMPLCHYDSVEVVPGIEGTFGIGHYEDHNTLLEGGAALLERIDPPGDRSSRDDRGFPEESSCGSVCRRHARSHP